MQTLRDSVIVRMLWITVKKAYLRLKLESVLSDLPTNSVISAAAMCCGGLETEYEGFHRELVTAQQVPAKLYQRWASLEMPDTDWYTLQPNQANRSKPWSGGTQPKIECRKSDPPLVFAKATQFCLDMEYTSLHFSILSSKTQFYLQLLPFVMHISRSSLMLKKLSVHQWSSLTVATKASRTALFASELKLNNWKTFCSTGAAFCYEYAVIAASYEDEDSVLR